MSCPHGTGRGSYLVASLGLPMVVAEGPPQQAEMALLSLFLSLGQRSLARGDLQNACCLIWSSESQNFPLFHHKIKALATGICKHDILFFMCTVCVLRRGSGAQTASWPVLLAARLSEKEDPAAEWWWGGVSSRQQTFYTKGQVVNILGFGAGSQLCCCSAKGM